MKRAVVLGGGGIVGIAWERGIIAGLASAGISLSEADIILGTSAGSVVGTQLACGKSFTQIELPSEEQTRQLAELTGQLDLALLGKVFDIWMHSLSNPNAATEIGSLAAQTGGWTEQEWLAMNRQQYDIQNWPQRDLRITALDIASGELRINTANNCALDRAIAASCAVPGMFPPITIDGRKYMDGGIITCTHADTLLADHPDVVIVIAPITSLSAVYGEAAEVSLNQEVAKLHEAGIEVLAITPNEADVAVFGPNMMDSLKAESVWRAGFAKGEALAIGEGQLWRRASS